ncbi:MAG: lysophospholipase [Labilithrix sp.]|nr:lysophospholipase [Labilithrix sp.]
MTIELDEGPVARDRGPALHFASAMPTGAPKAVLAMIHGYADHGARYAHVMGALAEHGIGAIVIDLRGHGRAGGARGYCNRFDEFLDDARELRRLVEARGKGAPAFLFGHSFGGLVASLSALDDPGPWRGLVLSAPFFGLALEVPRLKVLAGKIASRLVPKLGLPSGLAGADLTHDAARARAYDVDPLVFKKATARWFTEATSAQQRLFANASRLTMPLYETFGTADKVASMQAGKRFFDAAGSVDKTWDPREGLFHEVLNEPSWKEIVEAIARWVLAHAEA